MSEAKTTTWQTAITDIKPNKVMLRGYPIDQLMGRISYAQGVYLALRGELPDEKVGRIMEAILVSSLDHGVTPPSALAAMTAASTGAPLNAAIAAGILAINQYHGGAIEDAMRFFFEMKTYIDTSVKEMPAAVADFMAELKTQKNRVMGFGHRVHTNDPRTKRLFRMALELDLSLIHI